MKKFKPSLGKKVDKITEKMLLAYLEGKSSKFKPPTL